MRASDSVIFVRRVLKNAGKIGTIGMILRGP